jgi:hypothetical protein
MISKNDHRNKALKHLGAMQSLENQPNSGPDWAMHFLEMGMHISCYYMLLASQIKREDIVKDILSGGLDNA